MTEETKIKLLLAWEYCDDEDKSTEFMLQYMQDCAEVDLDTVLEFIQNTSWEERAKYFTN